jgi:hypothetical protein
MVVKFPDKQWSRQNSLLFHETIPLIEYILTKIGMTHTKSSSCFTSLLKFRVPNRPKFRPQNTKVPIKIRAAEKIRGRIFCRFA